ncbi:hypothetical protein GGI23_005126 [Coemansia sp. RSA 2559]|nr:hypothetical protein GGI23_005126 [Coemansia sp. RSA 2559]KAJ2853316.1 hypothetical protein GGI22_004914 [Coemansia erecta]
MSDPVVSMEECSDRLERLLQHVHKANEENAALKALKLPTTPKKPTLATSSTTSSSNGKADGSRRRTATVGSAERGQNASVRIQRRLEEIRARRLAREEDERKATAKDDRVALPMSHPTSAIQKKVERPRARREAREEKDRRAADACNPNSADTDDTSQDAKLPASKCTLSNSTSAGHPVNIGICTPPPSPPTDASLDVIHECDAYYALPGNPLEASIGLDTALQGAPMRDRALTWTPGCCRATILNQARKATSALSRTCIYAHNLEENTAEDPEPSPKSVDGAPEEIKWKCFHGFISLQYSTSQLSSVTSLTKITVSLSGAVITNVTEYTSRGDIQNRRLAIVKSRSPRRALAPGLVTGLHRMALQPLLDRIKELCTPTDK